MYSLFPRKTIFFSSVCRRLLALNGITCVKYVIWELSVMSTNEKVINIYCVARISQSCKATNNACKKKRSKFDYTMAAQMEAAVKHVFQFQSLRSPTES